MYQFVTQCKGDVISLSFKTAKIIVFDPMMCHDVPLQDELLCCVDHFTIFVVHVIQYVQT